MRSGQETHPLCFNIIIIPDPMQSACLAEFITACAQQLHGDGQMDSFPQDFVHLQAHKLVSSGGCLLLLFLNLTLLHS